MVEEGFFALVFPARNRTFKLAQQLLLPVGQLARHLHAHGYIQIALARTAQVLDALALNAENGSGLGALGHGVANGLIQGGHVDFRAQRGLGEGHRNLAVQVEVLALKELVGRDADLDIQIARRSAVLPGLALSAHGDDLAVVNARGHGEGNLAVGPGLAAPIAPGAGILDDLAGAVTGVAGAHVLYAPKGRVLGHPHLARALTGGTGGGAGARPGAGAVTGRSSLVPGHGDLLGAALGRLLKADAQIVSEVVALNGALAALAATPKTAPEKGAEDIVEAAKSASEAAEIGITAPAARTGARLLMAELIIGRYLAWQY